MDRNENLDEALNMIRKAVELRPQDGYIVDSLGWAYYQLGRYNDAVVELEKAVKLRPEDPTINDHMGDAYWRVGRLLEATFQWNHAIAGKPEPEELAKIKEKLKKGLPDIPGQSAADATKPAGKSQMRQSRKRLLHRPRRLHLPTRPRKSRQPIERIYKGGRFILGRVLMQ